MGVHKLACRWQWVTGIVLMIASPVVAQSYYLEDLGTLGGSTSVATAINDSGDVVGWSLTDSNPGHFHAFRWSNGVIENLLAGDSAAATSISSSGQIAGWVGGYSYSDGRIAQVWRKDGIRPQLPTPGQGLESWTASTNDDGQVVGAAVLDSFGTTHAVLWMPQSVYPSVYASLDLGTLGGMNSQANAINAAGVVVGSSSTASGEEHAFQWTKDGMKDLGTLGGLTSKAYAINNVDPTQVVGVSATTTGEQHACRWSRGQTKDLGTLPGCSECVAYGVNDAGQVVGTVCPDGDANGERAFLYTDDKGMIDLNALLPPALGWHLSEARAINNKGQIVGWGTRNGQQHAFRLSP